MQSAVLFPNWLLACNDVLLYKYHSTRLYFTLSCLVHVFELEHLLQNSRRGPPSCGRSHLRMSCLWTRSKTIGRDDLYHIGGSAVGCCTKLNMWHYFNLRCTNSLVFFLYNHPAHELAAALSSRHLLELSYWSFVLNLIPALKPCQTMMAETVIHCTALF